jgi:hypothetical protein
VQNRTTHRKQKDRLAAASPNQIGCFGQAAARATKPVRFLRHQPSRPPQILAIVAVALVIWFAAGG